MPVLPPTPTFTDANFPASGLGFELRRGGTLLSTLPLALRPTLIGGKLRQTLERTPLSNVVFTTGDGIADPDYLTLSGTVYWPDYRTALTQQSLIRQATRLADRVMYQGGLYTVLQLGTGNATFTPGTRDTEWTLTLELVPLQLLNSEVLGVNAGYVSGLLGVRGITGGVATVVPVPGSAASASTYTLTGANGAAFGFDTQTVDYTVS